MLDYIAGSRVGPSGGHEGVAIPDTPRDMPGLQTLEQGVEQIDTLLKTFGHRGQCRCAPLSKIRE